MRSVIMSEMVYFNPPAPCGAGPDCVPPSPEGEEFQSTRPVRGGTTKRRSWQSWRSYFNPPAPCGAGPAPRRTPRPPCDFNPPAPCGAGHEAVILPPGCTISIHPPRAGRDALAVSGGVSAMRDFNPPAPCGAGRCGVHRTWTFWGFQSTRPVRGGTSQRFDFPPYWNHFNPPAPCGAGRFCRGAEHHGQADFNPPAPCGAGPPALRCRPRT